MNLTLLEDKYRFKKLKDALVTLRKEIINNELPMPIDDDDCEHFAKCIDDLEQLLVSTDLELADLIKTENEE